ncbi:hypothetical protein AWC38_SpisGene16452 [Stylophora pistillata]|uniref:Uncharacterized protein n=1 Tax=Stylophora pistillata TaxID=50429 RepID=A0A2B4RS05_STYPI|nr:hypothetical protein AWC38_SpisGene16452 [Stylophora pistillata]
MMRISSQLLRSRTTQPLQLVEYLDLSNLGLVSLERLELCPKLQTLIVRGNRIEAVPDLRCYSQLWKIDLANNVVRSLEGLFSVAAFGTLILANNDLDWIELQKMRHVHILDLSLHGNHKLEMDAYYRMHVIDILPLVWMLDGRIITSAERAQVEQFFKDSALSDRPVRHKLPKNQFVPSSLKNVSVTGVFGQKREHLMRRFPIKEKLNVDLDKRRLLYLAYSLQQEVNLYVKSNMKGKVKPSLLIENLINYRNEDKERCNMLLLMLVASLEFAIPSLLVQQTLDITRLRKIRNVDTMDVFMLPRDVRCRVISLLLGAVKIEHDQHIDGGLYNRLYLCLYDLVADLVRLANGDSIAKYQATRRRLDSRKAGYRCLLASEVVQLLCIVPVFFDFIGKDPGVLDLIIVATKDEMIGERIRSLSWKMQSAGGGINRVSREVAEYLLERVKQANATLSGKKGTDHGRLIKAEQQMRSAEPSYVISSKRLLKTSHERPQSCIGLIWSKLERYNMPSGSKNRAMSAVGVKTSQKAGLMRKRIKSAGRKPVLGDRVEVGHQAYGRLVAIPESDMGLVQLETIAAPKFQQADYPISYLDQQFLYVGFADINWDCASETWRQSYSKGFMESVGRKGSRGTTLEGCHNREEVAQFLSDAIRQNLQLRVDLSAAHNTDTISDIGEPVATGETVITDHVRSIVRECLQEADVKWTSSYQPDINDNHMYDTTGNDEQPLEENADNLSIPVVASEVTAHADSESNKDCEVLDDNTEVNRRESEENLLLMKDECHGIALDDLGSESAQYFPVSSKEIEEMVSYASSESAQYFPVVSRGSEEMISHTEHARINAWKTPEVIKKATEKGVPSRVGGATTKLNSSSAAYPPPQRPSSPTQLKAIPIKQADRWLAGGRDVSCTSAKHISVPPPVGKPQVQLPSGQHSLDQQQGDLWEEVDSS